MLMILIIVAALMLTILAFAIKENIFHSPMLHGAALLCWMVATWLMVTSASTAYPGTFIPTAIGFFGMSMVIIEIVAILLPYIRDRKSDAGVYSTRQNAYKLKIAKMTVKKEKRWYE